MRKRSSVRILMGYLILGLLPIAYNIYIIISPRSGVGARFAYFALGLIVIVVGVVMAQLRRLQINYTNLLREYEDKVSQTGSLRQNRLPKLCHLEDEMTVPPLSSEQLYILQRLFWGDYRIHVKSLDGGYSNFGVFQVIEETTENNIRQPGLAVKFLSFRDIEKERNVYQPGGILHDYPLGFTPGRPTRSWPSDHQLIDSDRLGAVSYQFATLDPDNRLHTLRRLYTQCSYQNLEPYVELLFRRLGDWYDLQFIKPEDASMGGAHGLYERIWRRRSDIQRGISSLLKSSGETDAASPSFDDLDELEEIELPFLPEPWRRTQFYNPIHWINHVLVPGQADCFKAICPYSPIHGDLHTGNILVEEGKETRIWLVDFPNARIGPSLQDFATMEADIKFNLINLNRCSVDEWLEFEQHLLAPLSTPVYALNWPWTQGWQPKGELLKAWEFIGFLRSWVRNNRLVGDDVRSYYLALLHNTLPVVYRDATQTEAQQQYALTSAAWMCEYLST